MYGPQRHLYRYIPPLIPEKAAPVSDNQKDPRYAAPLGRYNDDMWELHKPPTYSGDLWELNEPDLIGVNVDPKPQQPLEPSNIDDLWELAQTRIHRYPPCAICLLPIAGRDTGMIRIRRCKHIFHQPCFDYWMDLLTEKKCPLCLGDVKLIKQGVWDSRKGRISWKKHVVEFRAEEHCFVVPLPGKGEADSDEDVWGMARLTDLWREGDEGRATLQLSLLDK